MNIVSRHRTRPAHLKQRCILPLRIKLPRTLPALLYGLSIALLASLSACTHHTTFDCQTEEERQIHERLYFGTEKTDGVVTDAEWADFLATVVTPHFPDGLTVHSGRGQWRGASGDIVREQSHMLSLVHRQGPKVEPAIDEIIRVYKQRFQQESVLRVRSDACVSFR